MNKIIVESDILQINLKLLFIGIWSAPISTEETQRHSV